MGGISATLDARALSVYEGRSRRAYWALVLSFATVVTLYHLARGWPAFRTWSPPGILLEIVANIFFGAVLLTLVTAAFLGERLKKLRRKREERGRSGAPPATNPQAASGKAGAEQRDH